MKQLIISLVSLTVIAGCVSDNQSEVPEHIANLENLTVYPADSEPEAMVEFIREITFGSTEENLVGRVGSIAVDDLDRVFISDAPQRTVHVLNPDGSYVTRIGREGEGPGAFSIGPIPYINTDILSLYDAVLLRWSHYSLDSFELSHIVNLGPIEIEEMSSSSPFRVLPRNDGMMLASFEPTRNTMPGQPVDNNVFIVYYLIGEDGQLASDKIYEQKAPEWLSGNVSGPTTALPNFPFNRKPLSTMADDGHIFSAWSEDFLIEVRNSEGEYLRAFYHPFIKRGLTRDEAIEITTNERRQNLVRNAIELPTTYPVLNSMLVDDERRLWISTIIDSNDVYEWWVLRDTGEVITKFEWPRDEPIEVVRNGNIYTRETEEESGLQQIVRYRIEIESSHSGIRS